MAEPRSRLLCSGLLGWRWDCPVIHSWLRHQGLGRPGTRLLAADRCGIPLRHTTGLIAPLWMVTHITRCFIRSFGHHRLLKK